MEPGYIGAIVGGCISLLGLIIIFIKYKRRNKWEF